MNEDVTEETDAQKSIYHRLVANLTQENTSLEQKLQNLTDQLHKVTSENGDLSKRYQRLLEENDLLRRRFQMQSSTRHDGSQGDNSVDTSDSAVQTLAQPPSPVPIVSTETQTLTNSSVLGSLAFDDNPMLDRKMFPIPCGCVCC